MILKLGVNVDHVATLREARYRGRGFGEPDPIAAALACEAAGAHGITIHLREDRRHIQDRDATGMRKATRTRLNLEMANTPEILAFAVRLKPEIVCLVPERRLEVTTEGGLDVAKHWRTLAKSVKRLHDARIQASLFIAPDAEQVAASVKVGSQFIELHTGAYAESFADRKKRRAELDRLIAASRQAHELGLSVNAGHGLNYENVPILLEEVPHLVELNIGHSLLSRGLIVGVGQAVREMLALMQNYRAGE